VDEVYFHDVDASIVAWERLRDRAREHRVFASATIAARADKKVQLLIAMREKK
jgi:hypothetical protein